VNPSLACVNISIRGILPREPSTHTPSKSVLASC
jgi:hypothetical protein